MPKNEITVSMNKMRSAEAAAAALSSDEQTTPTQPQAVTQAIVDKNHATRAKGLAYDILSGEKALDADTVDKVDASVLGEMKDMYEVAVASSREQARDAEIEHSRFRRLTACYVLASVIALCLAAMNYDDLVTFAVLLVLGGFPLFYIRLSTSLH